jgi:uncharacterized protein DUF1360
LVTPPPASTAHVARDGLVLVVDFLATYRLTTLIKDDKITEDLRRMVFRRFGEPDEEHSHKVSYLLNCPWCLSVYFAAGVVVARHFRPRVWSPVAKVLALSALTGLVSGAIDK